jgi:hypothetical protein
MWDSGTARIDTLACMSTGQRSDTLLGTFPSLRPLAPPPDVRCQQPAVSTKVDGNLNPPWLTGWGFAGSGPERAFDRCVTQGIH